MIFITGMFRSGTTLLSRILNAHREVTIAYDIYLPFFQSLRMKIASDINIDINGNYNAVDSYFYPVNDYYFSNGELNLFKIIQSGDLNYSIDSKELENLKYMICAYGERFEPRIIKHIDGLSGITYKDVFLSMNLLIKKANIENTRLFGFKDAWADEFIPSLIKSFPKIKIIQILRDPRAICTSKNYSNKTKPYPLIFITRRWRKHALLFVQYKNKYKENLFSIKYEELVTKPSQVIKDICRFLGIEFDENMLNTECFTNGEGRKWHQNSSFNVESTGINIESVDKWKQILSKKEIEFIEKMCFPEMLANNYLMYSSCDATKPMQPPIIPKHKLSEWITKYYPISEIDTVKEMKNELCCNKLVFERTKDMKLIERCFLLPEFYQMSLTSRNI